MPKILVAPLDWGLGHTTRCIPVIYHLLNCGAEVLLAGNDIQQAVLQKEFPACTFLPLKGYQVSYSRSATGMAWKILQQAPSLIKTIRAENKWLDEIIQQYKIDAVISDNRFGLYSRKVPCIFMTHQLHIKSNMGRFTEWLIQKINYRCINRFSACWVPDHEGVPNLAGQLSHPAKKPLTQLQYIGPLTRMQAQPVAQQPGHVLFILSGPEPQRSLFEQMIFQQLQNFTGSATVVRGLPAGKDLPPAMAGITIYNHLAKAELNKELCRAEYIIGRTGYSSVMDMAAFNLKPILVPTPGQPEQEYLAKYLSAQKFCMTASQQNFNLHKLLLEAQAFEFQNPFVNKISSRGEAAVQALVESLKA